MGQSLIFKNADFSAVAVENGFVDYELQQGGLDLILTSTNFGGRSASDTTNYPRRINMSSAFYWENGAKVKIKGLKGVDGTYQPTRIDGCYYSSQNWGHETVLGSLNGSSNYYPINVDGTEDEIEITNTWGTHWFVLCFAPQAMTVNMSPDGRTPIQLRVYNPQ